MSNSFSYFDGSLQDFINHISDIKDNRLVKIKLASVGSFCHVLDNFAVNHILNKHANEKEVLRGQIIIQNSDFELIPEIVAHFDSRSVIKPTEKRRLILYSKTYPDCEHVYIEEIRKGRHELAGVTYYKRKRKLTGAKS